jgi:cytochrome P450
MFLELAIVFIVTFFLWMYMDNVISGKDLPPGPTRWPIVGNLVQLAMLKKKAPYEMMLDMGEKYGPIFSLQIGMAYQVIFNDFETIKDTLASEAWADRYIDGWILVRSFGKPNGLLFGNGESWKELRRFSIRTLRDFGFGRQKGQDVIMEEELTDLVNRLNERLVEEKGVINMCQFFNISVLNILWSMMAGERFSHDDARLHKLVRGISNAMRMMSVGNNIMMAYPFLRHYTLRFTERGQQRQELMTTVHKQFKDILAERRALGYYKEDQRDFIDVFLKEIDDHRTQNAKTNYYTDDQYSVCTLDLFAAGSETTSSTLEFALLYMILNPKVQEKVQEEIDRVVGRNRIPNPQDKPNMPYTEATLLEVQRFANIVPMTVRAPNTDTVVGSYRIPKGSLGVFNLYSVHMNPKIWNDPEKFKPERFLDASGKNIINTQYLLPFGFGKRICLGEVLARATLFTYFATFMQKYTFSKDPANPELSIIPQGGMTQCPQPYSASIKLRY